MDPLCGLERFDSHNRGARSSAAASLPGTVCAECCMTNDADWMLLACEWSMRSGSGEYG